MDLQVISVCTSTRLQKVTKRKKFPEIVVLCLHSRWKILRFHKSKKTEYCPISCFSPVSDQGKELVY